LLLRLDGVLLNRYAERRYRPKLFQPPPSEEAGHAALEAFDERWNKKYPMIAQAGEP
jgi:hypothetical protein